MVMGWRTAPAETPAVVLTDAVAVKVRLYKHCQVFHLSFFLKVPVTSDDFSFPNDYEQHEASPPS